MSHASPVISNCTDLCNIQVKTTQFVHHSLEVLIFCCSNTASCCIKGHFQVNIRNCECVIYLTNLLTSVVDECGISIGLTEANFTSLGFFSGVFFGVFVSFFGCDSDWSFGVSGLVCSACDSSGCFTVFSSATNGLQF